MKHHGNGTQELLRNDPRFLFCSSHVFDTKKWFYPGSGGPVSEDGATNVVNVPLKRLCSSTVFKEGFKTILAALDQFKPGIFEPYSHLNKFKTYCC